MFSPRNSTVSGLTFNYLLKKIHYHLFRARNSMQEIKWYRRFNDRKMLLKTVKKREWGGENWVTKVYL